MGMEILKSWAMVTFQCEHTLDNFLKHPLWCNSCVQRAGTPIWNTAFSRYETILDFYDVENKKFFEYVELRDPNFDVLTYQGLINAIPAIVRLELCEMTHSLVKVDRLSQVCGNKYFSHQIYWQEILKMDGQSSTATLWSIELGINFDEEEWNALLVDTLKVTTATKLRYFQYRVLYRNLTTNVRRSKWNQQMSPLCTFCKNSPETVIHLLCECKCVQKLWVALRKWLNYYLHVHVQFSNVMIITQRYSGKFKRLVQLMVLILKQYIYASKCKEIHPEFVEYIERLMYWREMEKTIVYQENKFQQYIKNGSQLFHSKRQ